MLIYNVTVKVETGIEAQWVQWMKTEHIPQVLATGCFTGHKMLKLISEPATDGVTYAIQYFVQDANTLNSYVETHAPELRKAAEDRYKGRFVSFRTVLEEV